MDRERFADALMRAEAHLQRIRSDLDKQQVAEDAGKKIIDSLSQHWRDHRKTYTTAGALLLNQVRLELLTQLYGWRRQLRQQLQAQARQRPAKPGPDG